MHAVIGLLTHSAVHDIASPMNTEGVHASAIGHAVGHAPIDPAGIIGSHFSDGWRAPSPQSLVDVLFTVVLFAVVLLTVVLDVLLLVVSDVLLLFVGGEGSSVGHPVRAKQLTNMTAQSARRLFMNDSSSVNETKIGVYRLNEVKLTSIANAEKLPG